MPRLIRPAVITALILLVPLVVHAVQVERLDPNVSPVNQSVFLDLDVDRTDYSGSVSIALRVEKATSTFRFHAEDMELDVVTLRKKDRNIGVELERGEEGLVIASTAVELTPGNYRLDIEFSKPYNTQSVGLYRMEKDGEGFLYTQMEAVDARKAFPCWDEPIYKIPYQLTVRIPNDQQIVTNTPEEKTETEGDLRTVTFMQSPPMSSYLICIAAGRMDVVDIPGLSVPGKIYTPKGQGHLTKLAIEYMPPVLNALEEYFGRPYPYKKLDLIAVPEYWPGAMENPGAVTYLDNILLLDAESASVDDKRFLALVHAHEFAHMWFGDLVTMKWWDDLWLNESFADWMGEKIASDLFPDFKIDLFRMRQVQQLFGSDARPTTRPIRRPIVKSSDVFEDLGLAYGKGKRVLRMVEAYIGEETFRKGVIDYINTNEWGNTEAQDLFDALSKAAGKDVTPIFESFLDQSGYPLVTAEVTSKGVLTLSQQRFLNYGVEAEDRLWIVPVRIKYSDGENTKIDTYLLDSPQMQVDLGTNVEWLVPNAGSIGYYRWRVSEDMLIRLAADPEGKLDERERASFMADARSLLRSGNMAGQDYMQVLAGFATVPKPEIIDGVLSELGGLKAAFVTDDLEEEFALYIRETLRPAMETFGLEKQEREAPSATALRPRLITWMGRYGHSDQVRQFSADLAQQFMEDPSAIDTDIARAAFRVIGPKATAESFEVYKAKLESADEPAIRGVYVNALTSFADAELLRAALDYGLSDLRTQEWARMPQSAMSSRTGREVVWTWFTDNYDTITAGLPAEWQSFFPFLASGCEEERLETAIAFFGMESHQVDGTLANLEKVKQDTADCLILRERDYEGVKAYLNQLATAKRQGRLGGGR